MLAISHGSPGFERATLVLPAFGTAALILLAAGLLLATLPVSRLRWLGRAAASCWASASRPLPDRYDIYVDRQGGGAAVRGPDGRLAALGQPLGLRAGAVAEGGRRWRRAGALAAPTGGARCDRLGCTARLPDGRAVALVQDRRGFAEDCARAAVADHRASPRPPTCAGAARHRPHDFSPERGAVGPPGRGRDGSPRATPASLDRGLPWRLRPDPRPTPQRPMTAAADSSRADDSVAPDRRRPGGRRKPARRRAGRDRFSSGGRG